MGESGEMLGLMVYTSLSATGSAETKHIASKPPN